MSLLYLCTVSCKASTTANKTAGNFQFFDKFGCRESFEGKILPNTISCKKKMLSKLVFKQITYVYLCFCGEEAGADIFIFRSWLEMSWIADNWLIIHNLNRLTNQRAGKVLRHQKVLRHRVAFLKVLNWSDFLILPMPDFAKGCRLFNSLWGFESHCVTWTVMRTWQIKILCTTCAGVRFPFLDFYFPWCKLYKLRASGF